MIIQEPSARILAIVLSALHLFNFPFGTIAGVYGLYVLLSEEGVAVLQAGAARTACTAPHDISF